MAKFNPIVTKLEKSIQAGLRDAGRAVLKVSRAKSPEDAGDLKKEGFVAVDDLTMQIGYQSLKARLNHEDLDYEHDDGQAKFLEAAADEVDIGPILAARNRKDLGGG
ncbi:hypothetical protein [Microbacterium plantarum]|uniref:hypothetical protein n=1 Tax=Microbacterium plantarum TaxID=1816425 RepID=UPI002B49111F|nr:hypothetical protein [Microbacterium plantarum]WRK16119.1 hypothetical protein VC184_09315 [Microbacterium plantarum]